MSDSSLGHSLVSLSALFPRREETAGDVLTLLHLKAQKNTNVADLGPRLPVIKEDILPFKGARCLRNVECQMISDFASHLQLTRPQL